MPITTMAGLTKRNQGIKLYFIRCSRHSQTKMMFYNIKILMASSSMTNVEEEADDREISRRPQLCDRVDGSCTMMRGLPRNPSIQYPVKRRWRKDTKRKKCCRRLQLLLYVVYVYLCTCVHRPAVIGRLLCYHLLSIFRLLNKPVVSDSSFTSLYSCGGSQGCGPETPSIKGTSLLDVLRIVAVYL